MPDRHFAPPDGRRDNEIEAMTAALDRPDAQRQTVKSILERVAGGRQAPEAGAQQQPERDMDDAGLGVNG